MLYRIGTPELVAVTVNEAGEPCVQVQFALDNTLPSQGVERDAGVTSHSVVLLALSLAESHRVASITTLRRLGWQGQEIGLEKAPRLSGAHILGCVVVLVEGVSTWRAVTVKSLAGVLSDINASIPGLQFRKEIEISERLLDTIQAETTEQRLRQRSEGLNSDMEWANLHRPEAKAQAERTLRESLALTKSIDMEAREAIAPQEILMQCDPPGTAAENRVNETPEALTPNRSELPPEVGAMPVDALRLLLNEHMEKLKFSDTLVQTPEVKAEQTNHQKMIRALSQEIGFRAAMLSRHWGLNDHPLPAE